MRVQRMWTLLIVGLLGLGMARAAMAQPRTFDPERMKERMYEQVEELLKKMDLDEATAEKVRPILRADVDRRVAMMKERPKHRPEPGAMRERMEAIGRETEARLAEVLTEAQLERYRKLREEQRQAGRRGRPRRN